ncbi:MAG: HAD family hydrolase, partial [Salinibacterium sp.]|nr:HAD family hydrolase [Salinibacterium sp.]
VAGLTGVWLDRSGAGPVDEPGPLRPTPGIHTITTLAEVPALLA